TATPPLVIDKTMDTSPQALQQHNDPLLLERVLTRCKFNEALTPKPRLFHGSRAFLGSDTAQPANGTAQSPGSAENDTASKTEAGSAVSQGAEETANSQSESKSDESNSANESDPPSESPSTTEDAQANGSSEAASASNESEVPKSESDNAP